MAVDLSLALGILLAAVIAAGVWWFARVRGLVPGQRGAGAPPGAAARATVGATAPAAADDEDDGDGADDDGFDYAPLLRPQEPARAPASAVGAFRDSLEWQQLHRELDLLRQRCAGQDRIVAGLRADLEDMRTELESLREHPAPTPAPAGISPEYDAALAYARQGMDAAAIAERCGITLAEAALVCAMAAR